MGSCLINWTPRRNLCCSLWWISDEAVRGFNSLIGGFEIGYAGCHSVVSYIHLNKHKTKFF